MRIGHALAIGIVLTLLPPIDRAAAAPLRIEPKGPYVHRGTGFVFPEQAGDFRRTSIIEYDDEATDVSAGYSYAVPTPERTTIATVYVYPVPPVADTADPAARKAQQDRFCREHFDTIKAEVAEKHRSTVVVEESKVASPSPNHRQPGLRAAFTFEDVFRGKEQPLRSEARLFCHVDGQWLIAYRFTAPAGHDLSPDIARLTAALPWPRQ